VNHLEDPKVSVTIELPTAITDVWFKLIADAYPDMTIPQYIAAFLIENIRKEFFEYQARRAVMQAAVDGTGTIDADGGTR
jgi:hypothetical protein